MSERFNGNIDSGMPMTYWEGARDLSMREITATDPIVPICSLIVFSFAEKGGEKPTLTPSHMLRRHYGDETFNPKSPFYNQQMDLYLNAVSETNASVVFHRLIPEDARNKSNVVVYCDILQTDIPNYLRNMDGSYVIDENTKKHVVNEDEPTVKGFKVKFIAETLNTIGDNHRYGMLKQKEGTMKVRTKNTKGEFITRRSRMYPLFEIAAPFFGEYYNTIGFSITPSHSEKDRAFLKNNKAMLYELQLWTRTSLYDKPQIFRTLLDETLAKFSFRPGSTHPTIKTKNIEFDSVFPGDWVNKIPGKGRYRDDFIEEFYVYQNNLENICKMVYQRELKHIYNKEANKTGDMQYNWYDFTTPGSASLIKEEVESEHFLMDIFQFQTSKGVPYKTLIQANEVPDLEPTQEEVYLNNTTPVFLKGGTNGTMNNEVFERLIRQVMERYGDTDDVINNMNTNLGNTIIDSGFTLETKQALTKFLTYKPDAFVHFTTHVRGEELTRSDQLEIANNLKALLALYPESLLHNTDVCRATIAMGDLKLFKEKKKRNRVPLTYEVANKLLRMFGSDRFNLNYRFDGGKHAELKLGADYAPDTLRDSVKEILWMNCVNWAEAKSATVFSIPTLLTVYGNETSVLRNVFGLYAMCKCIRVAQMTHKDVEGSALPKIDLDLKVKTLLNRRLEGVFGDMVKVSFTIPTTRFDKESGYSYTVVFSIQAPTSRTVGRFGFDFNRFSSDDEIAVTER